MDWRRVGSGASPLPDLEVPHLCGCFRAFCHHSTNGYNERHSKPDLFEKGDPMKRTSILSLILLVALAAQAQQPDAATYQLKPTPKTVAWGYYDASTPP